MAIFQGRYWRRLFKVQKRLHECSKTETYQSKKSNHQIKRKFAKSLIPASTSDIDKAFTKLEKACGDTMYVVSHSI